MKFSTSILSWCLILCGSAASQAACSFTLSPNSASYGQSGGAGSFGVTASKSTCSWTASTASSWIHTTSSSTGNGTVNYTVDANGGTGSRSGTIAVGSSSFTITQSGAPLTFDFALNTSNLVWTTASDYPWIPTNDVTHDGVAAAHSGNRSVPNSTSWLQTTVTGPGTIAFWWKVDSDVTPPPPATPISFDYLAFLIDGQPQNQIMGAIDWNYMAFPVPDGAHTLTWEYVKDGQYNSAFDRGWLDQVSWSPRQPISLETALDTCSANFFSDGAIPTLWTGETNVTHDGVSAAQSGTIWFSQDTWMQTVVSGVSNVSFWWKVSSQTNFDFLEFYTNGVLAKHISGEVNWQSNFFNLPTNGATLEWRYVMTNGLYTSIGSNAAWVDQVHFNPNVDTAPPVITLLGPNPLNIECHGTFTDPGATAVDGCAGVVPVMTNINVNPDIGGSYSIDYIAADPTGNYATNTRTVNVVDTAPPLILYSVGSMILGAGPNCRADLPDLTGTDYIVAADNCGGVTISQSPDSGTTLPLGSFQVTLTAMDDSGNTTNTLISVTVADTTPPMITLLGQNPITIQCHGTFTDPGATALDNCAGSVAVTTNGTVNPNATGSYSIQYVASDPSGNYATNTRTVNVVDLTPPVITLLGANPNTVECHGTFTDPGATAIDDCAGSVAVSTNGTVNPNATGSYFLRYVATDPSGNSATNTRTVNVVDTTPPTILFAFTNLALEAVSNCQAVLPDLTGTNYFVAVDNCSSVTVTQSPPAATLLSLGTNMVVLTALDAANNSVNSTNFVIVTDTTPPALTCPPDLTLNADLGQCGASNVSLGLPTVSDNCSVASATNNAPNFFPVGTNIVTWTATDSNGNSTNAVQQVIIVDAEPPQITAPAPVTVAPDAGQTYASGVSLGTPTTSDNCGVASLTNNAPLQCPVGTHLVTWTVTDIHGNSNTCFQQVIVTAPISQVPHWITAIINNGDGTMTLSFTGAAQVVYVLQASSNLVDWLPIHTNTSGSDGTWTCTDSNASAFPIRFYRSYRP